MNVFAHLATASWISKTPEFCLGAMLPDFATMAGVRLPALAEGPLAEGVAFHHEGDRVFHRLKRFRDHEAWTLNYVQTQGLRRGPARGVAHVGVELCLDGALVADEELQSCYRSAIELAHSTALPWEDAADAERFATLVDRLRAFGAPVGYQTPSTVSDRLIRILAPRPLLRLTEAEEPILRRSLPSVHRRVTESADALMDDLRQAL